MIRFIIILNLFLFFMPFAYSQQKIPGEYVNGMYGTLGLKPGGIYYWKAGAGCAMNRINADSGRYIIKADTIITYSKDLTQTEKKKYLIVKLDSDSLVCLKLIKHSDSLLVDSYPGRLNSFEYTDGSFMKTLFCCNSISGGFLNSKQEKNHK